MLNPDKSMILVPVEGIVEACLDFTPATGNYALRVEGMDARVIILPDGGAVGFLRMFEKFVEEYLELKEATLHDD